MVARYEVDPLCFPGWDGTVGGARSLQQALAAQVRLADELVTPLRLIAGLDVGFEERGSVTRAVALLLDAESADVLAEVVVRRPTAMPYIPGLLSFRELPALLQALRELPGQPDLLFVDGQGIAHPRRLGIAAHLGVVADLPSIGVAKTLLVGRAEALGEARGERTKLMDRDEQIGWLLRSKNAVRPLVVSPGHRVGMLSVPDLVLRYVTRYRLPEPTRLADRLASRRAPGMR